MLDCLSTVPLAIAASPVSTDLFKQEYSTYVTAYNTIDGNIETIKIQAPPDPLRAQVRAALNQVVADTVKKLNQPNKLLGDVSDDDSTDALPMPIVHATDVTPPSWHRQGITAHIARGPVQKFCRPGLPVKEHIVEAEDSTLRVVRPDEFFI